MNTLKKWRFLLLGLAGIIISVILILPYLSEKKLPIFNPADFNPALVDISMQEAVTNHTVADFELINQNGKTITQDDYKNKIYVTDFFFAKCPTICPIMTANLSKIQDRFIDKDEIMLLSISVTPVIDSVAVLNSYAKEKGVIDHKWNVTTGDKKHIYNLARKSYFAVVDEGDGGVQDFIHTPNFILVDKKKQIRGVYDGTNDQEIERLITDIDILIKQS